MQNSQIKIFFTLIINFLVIFLAYSQTAFLLLLPIISLFVSSLDTCSVVGGVFSHMASLTAAALWKVYSFKITTSTVLWLCCRLSGMETKEKCFSKQTQSWYHCLRSSFLWKMKKVFAIQQRGCSLWPAANLEPQDSWPGLALRKAKSWPSPWFNQRLGLVALFLLRG